MDLNITESLVVAKPIDADGVLVTGIGRGGKDREYAVKKAVLEYHKGHRARKGKALDIRWKATDLQPLPKKDSAEPEAASSEELSDTLF